MKKIKFLLKIAIPVIVVAALVWGGLVVWRSYQEEDRRAEEKRRTENAGFYDAVYCEDRRHSGLLEDDDE